jgi:twitching motility two-component system response regulator PilH
LARKVLLADDSVTAQNMGRKILTDAGYEVVTVNNGSAALKKIAEAHPDLIVLDVYMPGYSGLEVCQRIKDSRDTNHIPVLLTVGKLEPFKQDEARRVRADAFIIKPFEASELTAALSKLESRVTSAAPPRKDGRHSAPATMESFERTTSASAPQFGDEESGWKARLKFPGAGSKGAQVEPEPEPYPASVSGNFRELIPESPAPAPQNFAPMMERPIPAGIPQDITPDEIAAIAAAAARVQAGISVGKNFEKLSDAPQAPSQKGSSTASSVAAQSETQPCPGPSSEKSHEASDAPFSAGASSKHGDHDAAPEMVAPLQEPSTLSSNEAAFGGPAVRSSNASEPSAPFATAPEAERVVEPEPVTAAIAPSQVVAAESAVAVVAGPRWVAEEIPVEAHESLLVLEREMHKAYAAFAAAEHGQTNESAPVDKEDEPIFATMAPPAIGTPLPMMVGTSERAATRSRTEKDAAFAPKPVAPAAETTFQKLADLAEVSKPPAPSFAPANPGRKDADHSVAAFGGPQPFGMAEAGASTEVESASASTASSEKKLAASEMTSVVSDPKPFIDEKVQAQSATQRGKPDEKTGAQPADPPNPEKQREAELAAATGAAWANWREVRESVVGTKAETASSSAANTEAELEELKRLKGLKKDAPAATAQPAPGSANEGEALAAAASADNSGPNSDPNLSSIVDNMLAELKPKLMAELAEKLSRQKTTK